MFEERDIFEKLTPVDNIDLDIYEDAMDFIFKNHDIKNVAISGAYGAGKSSVLATYEVQHNEIEFLHISLAHFQDAVTNDIENIPEQEIEGKILNQLIHQIPTKKIPQTNFRVKKTISYKQIIITSISIILFIASILHFLFFEQWEVYINSLMPFDNNVVQDIFESSIHQHSTIFSGIVIICGIFWTIYNLIKTQKVKNIFRKISFQGNEIEIFEETGDSCFDKYLNEVLYLFENSGVDVIVFEDVDRFNTKIIFERLREINTLANIRLEKEDKKIIRFFYLMRDDIFNSKDRTKFFDFIVPIIPVIDSSNSYDKFIELLEKHGYYSCHRHIFEDKFLQDLMLYIDDMRILKNIYNEFHIYYKKLNTTELNPNKMLAIITYKNLFPKDFSELHFNKGFVWTLFSKKEEFIHAELKEIEEKIHTVNDGIQAIKKESLETLQELDDVYEAKKKRSYYRSENISDWYKNEYPKRKTAIEKKIEDSLSDMEKELSQLEQQKKDLNNKPLKNIITRKNIDEIFRVKNVNELGKEITYEEIKDNEYFDLLKYLIRNGYIDETYADYMTYFYEHSIKRNDKMFLRSITDKKARTYDFELDNPDLVVSRLRGNDFEQEEILNFSLLEYLLETPKYSEELEKLFLHLKESENYKFISECMDYALLSESEFVKNLNSQWPDMLRLAIETGKLPEEKTYLYSVWTLSYSDKETIEKINEGDFLRKYISNYKNYLDIKSPDVEKLIEIFKMLKVSFANVNYEKSNNQLFYEVYRNSLYDINAENLRVMLQNACKLDNEYDIRHKNYTLILSLHDQPLCEYIENNISEYVDAILKMSDGIIEDSEDTIISILNNKEVTVAHKKEYIKRLNANIKSIESIDDTSLWKTLIEQKIIEFSEENIMKYFIHTGSLDAALVKFINSGNKTLCFKDYDYDARENLFDAMVICNDIDDVKYSEIVASLGLHYNEFDIEGISNEKIEILIDNNIIKMGAETLEFIRNNYPYQIIHFIEKNSDIFVKSINDNLITNNEVLEVSQETRIEIFKSQSLSLIKKVELLAEAIPSMSDDEITEILGVLGYKKLASLLKRNSYPHISQTETNEMLMEALKNKGWIYDYETNPNTPGLYKIIRKAQKG